MMVIATNFDLPLRYFTTIYSFIGIYEIRRNSITSGPLRSPRQIGNSLYKSSAFTRQPSSIANIGGLFFGQYISHDYTIRMAHQIGDDISLMRCCSGDYTERLPRHLMSVGCLPIDLPRNDEYYSQYNMTCMEFLRGLGTFPQSCEWGHIEQVHLMYGYQLKMKR